jgi:tRNA pseudouridine13 synthase
MFGPKMVRAAHEVLAREEALLSAEGLTLSDFQRGGDEAEGARRPYRIPLAARIEELGTDLVLAFELPKGSYATVVLRELLKA